MSSGRTIWWGKDVAWWEREAIVELGEEFGAAGPAVIDWLCCRAKMQNDGGKVKAGYRAIARGVFIDAVTVSHVVSRAVQLGALDDFEESDRTFTCRISGWAADQGRADAAARKAKSRAKSTASHGESRSVTPGPKMSPTEEKRRLEAAAGARAHTGASTTDIDDARRRLRASAPSLDEILTTLRQVPQWKRNLDQGGELAVLGLIESNPGHPWLDLAADAATSRLDPDDGALRTDSPVYALKLKLQQASRRPAAGSRPVQSSEKEQRQRARDARRAAALADPDGNVVDTTATEVAP